MSESFEQMNMLDCKDFTYEQVQEILKWHEAECTARVEAALERLKEVGDDYLEYDIVSRETSEPILYKAIEVELANLQEERNESTV